MTRTKCLLLFLLTVYGLIFVINPIKVFSQENQFDVNERPYYIWDYALGKDSFENLYIIWGDDRNTSLNEGTEYGTSIYLQKYYKALIPIGENQRITERKDSVSAYPGDILVFDDGKHIIAYAEYLHKNNELHRSIWIKGFYQDGAIWFQQQRVDELTLPTNARIDPKLVELSDSTFAVYWMDNREEGKLYSYVQKYTSNAKKNGQNFRLNPDHLQNSVTEIHYIEENLILVQYWNIRRASDLPQTMVQYFNTELEPQGELLTLPKEGLVTPLSSDSLFLSYTLNDAADIYYQFLNPDMSARDDPKKVNDDDTVNPKIPPQIIVNPNGEGYMLVWEDYRNGIPGKLRFSFADIYGQNYDENDQPIGGNIKLNYESREMNQSNLKVTNILSDPLIFFSESRALHCSSKDSGGIGVSLSQNNTLVGKRLKFNNLSSEPILGWRNALTKCDNYEAAPSVIWLQNYPNPFNSQTTLVFEVESSTAIPIRIKIYDTLGSEVAYISESRKYGQGIHEIIWNPIGLKSGLYIANFVGHKQSIKLLLLK